MLFQILTPWHLHGFCVKSDCDQSFKRKNISGTYSQVYKTTKCYTICNCFIDFKSNAKTLKMAFNILLFGIQLQKEGKE